MQPKPSADTSRRLLPNGRVCITLSLLRNSAAMQGPLRWAEVRGARSAPLFSQFRGAARPPGGLDGDATLVGSLRINSGDNMTGTIKTLRAEKGFGFIKGAAGQEYFFHQSAIYGEGINDLREG